MIPEYLSENGSSILVTKAFWSLFNKPCSMYSIGFDTDEEYFDITQTNISLLDEIGYAVSKEDIIFTCNKYWSMNKHDWMLSPSNSMCYFFVKNLHPRIIGLSENWITCAYPSWESIKDIDKELKELWNKLPKTKRDANSLESISLVAYSDGEYYTVESKLNSKVVDINENYNDDFIKVNEDILQFLDSRESGLVMLYGTHGTGKTSYIRHLCCTKQGQYIIIPTSLTNRLGDPDFISFMLNHSDSIFILEDCEQILMDRNINMFNGAISNILNMSDGLLSDIMNIKFICTFNAEISSIDKALLRKGRCYAKYEFKELAKEKVKVLNEKYNLGLTEIKPMTLAEIYNSDKTSYEEKTKKRIGF